MLLAEAHRDVHLEQLPELALRDVLLALVRSLTSAVSSPSEPFLEVVADRERLTDQLVLVGVEDLAGRGPELDPRQLAVGDPRLERGSSAAIVLAGRPGPCLTA